MIGHESPHPMTPGDRVRLTLAQLWGHALAPEGSTATVVDTDGQEVRVELDDPLIFDGARVAFVWVDSDDLASITPEGSTK